MILDRLVHFRHYAVPGSRLERAFLYLAETFDPALPDGRVDVQGDDVFALIQGYPTRPPEKCRLEAHRRYIDIQYVFEGAEDMAWAPLEGLAVSEPYSDERDVAFFHNPPSLTRLHVPAGSFAVFHPQDAHAPGLQHPGFATVRKVVMKVRVEHT